MDKIIVLAGNRKEFEFYLNKNGLTDSEAVYGYEPNKIYGIRASKVDVVGTFWERKDAGKLFDLANTRLSSYVSKAEAEFDEGIGGEHNYET